MKNSYFSFFLISLILLGILILKFSQNSPVKSVAEETYLPVNTIKPKIGAFKNEFIFYGNVEGISEINIVSQLDGQVTKVSKKLFNGGSIKKGEILFEIDSLEYREDVVEKESILNDLNSEMKKTLFLIKEAEKQFKISNKNYERKKKLFGNTVSKKGLEDAELNLSISLSNLSKEKFKVESLKAQIRKAKAKLNISEKNLTNTRYRAPFNGKVFNNQIDKGIEVIKGSQLAKFVNTDMLEVKFFVGESSFTRLGAIDDIIGREVIALWSKSDFKKKYTATITKIDSVIDNQLAGLNMYAELESLEDTDPIRPGVFVEMIVEGPSISNTFLVPENAIYEEKYIYVLREEQAVREKVNLKGDIKNYKIAQGNITSEDRIIVDKIQNIEEIQNIYSINN